MSICDVSTVQCEEKKKERKLPNVTKVRLYMMLILPNVTIEPSNVIDREYFHHLKICLIAS